MDAMKSSTRLICLKLCGVYKWKMVLSLEIPLMLCIHLLICSRLLAFMYVFVAVRCYLMLLLQPSIHTLTGKSTVARIIAKLFYLAGALASYTVTEMQGNQKVKNCFI